MALAERIESLLAGYRLASGPRDARVEAMRFPPLDAGDAAAKLATVVEA